MKQFDKFSALARYDSTSISEFSCNSNEGILPLRFVLRFEARKQSFQASKATICQLSRKYRFHFPGKWKFSHEDDYLHILEPLSE